MAHPDDCPWRRGRPADGRIERLRHDGGSTGAALALGGGALTTLVGFGLSTRWAKTHIPGLRTFAIELAAERDACHRLRTELKQRRAAAQAATWDEWRPRIVDWDTQFWQLLERRLPDLWKVYRREHAVVRDDYGDRWAAEMVDLLDKRLALIKTLLEREHGA